MPFDYFYKIICKVLFVSFLHLKAKYYFYNYEYDYVVGYGTMVWVDGGGSIATVYVFV